MKKIYFYHYKPLKCLEHLTWLQNYINQKIWFTRLDSFNDKFEGRFVYKSDNMDKPNTVDNYLQSHGALCLTRDYSNIPMWAHYANNYQGYCVIFELDLEWIRKSDKDFSQLPEEQFKQYIDSLIEEGSKEKQEILLFHSSLDSDKRFVFTKILYQNQPPEMREVDLRRIINEIERTGSYYEHTKYIIQNSIGVKFDQWKYEGEYRLIVNTNSISSSLMDLRGYPFLKVTGIIMGEELGKNLDQDVSNFLKTFPLDEKNVSNYVAQEKLKNFIYTQANSHNIQIFIAKKSLNLYKIYQEEYRQNNLYDLEEVMDNQVVSPGIDIRTNNTPTEYP